MATRAPFPRALVCDADAARGAAIVRRLREEGVVSRRVGDPLLAAEMAARWLPDIAVMVDDTGDTGRALRATSTSLPLIGIGPGTRPDRVLLAQLDVAAWLSHADVADRLGLAVDSALRQARSRALDVVQREGMRHLLAMATHLTSLRPTGDFHRAAIEGFSTLFGRGGATGLFVLERARDGSSVCAGTGRFREVTSRGSLLPVTARVVERGLMGTAKFARGPNWVCVPVDLGGVDHACLLVEGVVVPDGVEELCAMYAAQVAHALSNVLLYERATVDGLTGLCNRAYGSQRLAEILSLGARHPAPTAVCLLDIDRFKSINDTWGHAAGDAVLRGIGGVLRGVCRDTDNVCRFGGEEFLVLLPHTEEAGAVRVAERIRVATQRWTGNYGHTPLCATVSIGVAVAAPGDRDLDALLARADAALYEAKRDGRNRVRRAA